MNSKSILIISLILLGFTGCHKESSDGYKSEGLITGPDYRMCPCCGGWYIKIDTVVYEFDSIPSGSSINLQNASFPIFVKLDWKRSNSSACPDDRILIQRIVRYYPPD